MKIIDADWYDTMKALHTVEEQAAVTADEVDSEPQREAEKNEMAKNEKATLEQLKEAAAVLMRFLEEYQTVNHQNSDAIVEYEEKVRLITGLLAIKKFDGLDTYSLLDLLNAKAKDQTCPVDGHQMECILNHYFVVGEHDCVDFVGDHNCVPVCTQCQGCRHGKRRTNCSDCGVVQWEEKAEHSMSESHPSV
jgi:hypothetical protein